MELTVAVNDTIDKRVFLDALTCATRGWYSQRAPREGLTPADEWSFYGGNQVGGAARVHLNAQTAATFQFEASFRDGPFVARGDAVRRNGQGWDLIEVKSAKEPEDGKVKREFLDDLAYTVMVARAAGQAVDRCVLMLLSRAYRLGIPGSLFIELDVTAAVLERADEFATVAPEIAAAILGVQRPEPVLKSACNGCAFFAHGCIGDGVATSIFVIPRLGEKRIEQIRPIVDLFQVSASIELTDNQRRVFDVVRSGKPLIMPGLARLDDVVWPAYYLDFETVAPFLPWFAGDGVHDVHPFQYSIHRCDHLGASASHDEYLAPLVGDWRRELVEQMLSDLGEIGSVVVYTDFEERRLRAMAALFPDLAERIQAVIARLFDLHDVVKGGYCHPGFKGRTSIKNVFPALVPGPGYQDLAITEGQSASGVFGLMRVGKCEEATFDQRRRDLLEYCKLDTLAMLRVHQVLAQVRGA